MSIQWTIIAGFLYLEIALVLLLVLPFISPSKWQKVFKSKFLKGLESQSSIYFNVFIVLLVLFFGDAIREMYKYNTDISDTKSDHHHSHLDAEMQISMKLFRAQRNFYVTGFSLFLWLVLRRLVTLISAQATLIASNEASMKQAASASNVAKQLMDDKEKRDKSQGETAQNKGNDLKEEHEKQVKELRKHLMDAQEESLRARADMKSMKQQAESVSAEYDRLMREHTKLQNDLVYARGDQSGKKDE